MKAAEEGAPNNTHDRMRLERREIYEACRFRSSPAASVD
jgi:hypothetical protein